MLITRPVCLYFVNAVSYCLPAFQDSSVIIIEILYYY
jgi:hypothetical protein